MDDATAEHVPVPEFTDVDSSNLAAVAFDGARLFVKFHGGEVGYYANVPQSVYDDLLQSASKGKFLHGVIEGAYDWHKVT